ncbi:BQ2448_814 [Microbotryum intermedium]|uniref:BQ2448_814 protein n=1 Tax=Microbotryum intermedium TaxID=269621 RepID=A0A238F9K3_9BASI|nr:BQ2448_814 [Microbotryum intermedium]
MFIPLYSALTLPSSIQDDHFPSQFYIAPTLRLSTLTLLTLGWLCNMASSS